jgi:hypothetical protein
MGSPSSGEDDGEPAHKEDAMQTDSTLFGDATERPEDAHVAPSVTAAEFSTPGHREVVTYYHTQYKLAEGRKYPWRPRDFKVVQQLIVALGDVHAVYRAVDRFLATRTAFYRGHELRKLYDNLAEFAGDAGGGPGWRDAGTDARSVVRD